jgi:hypothetical protein
MGCFLEKPRGMMVVFLIKGRKKAALRLPEKKKPY